MAEPDKIPETQSDTEATFDQAAEEQTSMNDSSMMSESQDFHLIDCGESQKETQFESKATPSEVENEIFLKVAAEPDDEKSAVEEPSMKSEEELEIQKNDDLENVKIEEKVEKSMVNNDEDDDEDDFVQSSQAETDVTLNKQISNLASVLSQKRKADDSDEPSAKFPRTCSREDALTTVRKKNFIDEVDEIFTKDETKVAPKNEDTTIIAETQESCEIVVEKSLQQVEQDLEEALSQDSPEDEAKTKVKDTIESNSLQENSAIERIVEEKESPDLDFEDEPKIPAESNMEVDQLIPNDLPTSTVEKIDLDVGIDETAKEIDDTKEKTVDITVEENSPKKSDENSPEKSEENSPLKNDSSINDTSSKTNADNSPIKNDENSSKNGEDIVEKDDSSKINQTNAITSTCRSRMSIEVIYDRATAPPEKKPRRELVEIDEDGEKIILDSSQELCEKSMDKSTIDGKIDTSYKTCVSSDYKSIDNGKDTSNDYKSNYSLTNGSTDSKDTDSTITAKSDLLLDSTSEKNISSSMNQNSGKKPRIAPSTSKITENPEIIISDSEGESFVVDERIKPTDETPTSLKHNDSTTKITTIEKELSIIVKLKCLVSIDETSKEHVEKIITGVNCESTVTDFSSSRRRNSDASACLADISGNDKDASPSSVTSNLHPYPLNPRLSMASATSSSSNSSAGSLNARIIANNIKMFQLPRGPAKHAKKMTTDSTSTDKKNESDDAIEQIRRDWKNVDVVTTTLMNFASNELNSMDLHNRSNERVVDNSLERIHSSTPEVTVKKPVDPVQTQTPKRDVKRGRSVKTARSKNLRSSDTNGIEKNSTIVETETPSTSRKRKSSPETITQEATSSTIDQLNESNDELIGKDVFAKWSDKKYYPGTVIGKTKTKFKVNFYDGQNKMIIEDFIVPMPATLSPGLSVYATSENDDYGSCGIILDVKRNKDGVVYIVETDEREKIHVNIKDIFLTNDQVQVLKEDTKSEIKSPPATPKHLGKVSLDNVIDGKRRSKRVLTPIVTTPKGKRGRSSLMDKMADTTKPSASGTASSTSKFEDNYDTTDSNYSANEDNDFLGVQMEIIGTPNEQEGSKGPQSAIKGKARSRKRSEKPEVVAHLGPVPTNNSDIFRNMSFILTCASPDAIERFQAESLSRDAKDSSSDPGTENEEEWTKKPFVRDRLVAQLIAGGGKVYDKFELIPPEEYERTKHVTNVPNTTRKSLLCLSVGIKTYNHQWIIRCCQENKIVNPSEEELPAGWSILKRSYIDMFQRRNEKPFQTLPVIVVIPVTPANKEFVSFWRQICENAGGAVLLVKKPDDGFIEGTVVLTNKQCPSWVIEKASAWSIPLVSTVWIIECLIEGNICGDDAHPSFKYNYVKKSSSNILHSKRR